MRVRIEVSPTMEEMISTEQFKKALAVTIDAMAELEREFERLDAYHSDGLSRGYTFDQDL